MVAKVPETLTIEVDHFYEVNASSTNDSAPESPHTAVAPSSEREVTSVYSVTSYFSVLAVANAYLPILTVVSLVSDAS